MCGVWFRILGSGLTNAFASAFDFASACVMIDPSHSTSLCCILRFSFFRVFLGVSVGARIDEHLFGRAPLLARVEHAPEDRLFPVCHLEGLVGWK